MTESTTADRAAPASSSGEVCFNLWAYADEDSGVIHRIAARPYVLDGSEQDRLAVLRSLAATDFYATEWAPVPERFVVVGPDGRKVTGASHVTSLDKDREALFGPLIESLAIMPTQLVSVAGSYTPVQVPTAPQFTYVLTVVVEREDGRLEPQVCSNTAIA